MTGSRDVQSLTNRTLGDFTVGAKLGEGGHGVVYRAEQRTLGRAAVIKVLHARHGTQPELIQRFLREAQLASRLDHPYAAHVYAFGAEPDGLLWIAMELVRGTTLRKVLAAQPGGRLALARMVPLLDGLCEVVHSAHELGIVHRDVKPDNVMVLSRAGRLFPKLLDLGIAKLVTAGGAGPGPAA
ncbi:MAG TPA: serine/threonine-protein kinase, partial [Kofleriaceae bacterium]|nr:serine/threonine-protein kinase [Kofleriaceae bacterium]